MSKKQFVFCASLGGSQTHSAKKAKLNDQMSSWASGKVALAKLQEKTYRIQCNKIKIDEGRECSENGKGRKIG